MPNFTRRTIALASLATLATALAPKDRAFAQKKYGPGVSDTEIKIGQTIAYSGPASAYGQIGTAEAAYFKMINDRGGINGRKITFISLDDSYSPPKAVEQTRRLVEQDEVAVMFGMLGTPLNLATRTYLNNKKVPQLFVAAGSEQFANPEKYPWTIGFQPTLRSEGTFFGQQILAVNAAPKIGVLYQYDDFGKELLSGLTDGLGGKAALIVAAESFTPADPTIDSQIVKLKSAGADTVMLFSYAKQAAQAIRKIYELNWKPDTYLHSGASSVSATLAPAGLEQSTGIKTAHYAKDASDPQWLNDPELKPFYDWIKDYVPGASPSDTFYFSGWSYAQILVHVLRQCGDDLTRENIMRQATSLKDYRNPSLLPGSLINTSPTDYRVVEYMRLKRFNGKTWENIGT
jgi:ABC-type branched-subunit amino acid transport system substrate-binding protein